MSRSQPFAADSRQSVISRLITVRWALPAIRGLQRRMASTSGLADADDLASYNSIAAMHAMAEATPGSVVFPEYLVAFGRQLLHASNFSMILLVGAADIIYGHGYISRMFLRRDVFIDLQFADVRLSQGFAYEDWHLNCELKARGLRFLIAPQTVFYYPQAEREFVSGKRTQFQLGRFLIRHCISQKSCSAVLHLRGFRGAG